MTDTTDIQQEQNALLLNDDIQLVNGLPLPTRRTRKRLVYLTLFVCTILIGATTFWGNPANTLHVSAQSWGFGLFGAVIFAYVFGAVIDNFNVMKTTGGTLSSLLKK